MSKQFQMALVFDDLACNPMVEQFWKFHVENPGVYKELLTLALRMKRTGRKRYGMKGLFEVLRWHRALETTDEEFKLNNNYTAFYARMLMKRLPELDGFFAVRGSVAD